MNKRDEKMETVTSSSNNYLQIGLQIVRVWGPIVISAISMIIAIVSLIKSSKAQRLQNKVNELELKLKQSLLQQF